MVVLFCFGVKSEFFSNFILVNVYKTSLVAAQICVVLFSGQPMMIPLVWSGSYLWLLIWILCLIRILRLCDVDPWSGSHVCVMWIPVCAMWIPTQQHLVLCNSHDTLSSIALQLVNWFEKYGEVQGWIDAWAIIPDYLPKSHISSTWPLPLTPLFPCPESCVDSLQVCSKMLIHWSPTFIFISLTTNSCAHTACDMLFMLLFTGSHVMIWTPCSAKQKAHWFLKMRFFYRLQNIVLHSINVGRKNIITEPNL